MARRLERSYNLHHTLPPSLIRQTAPLNPVLRTVTYSMSTAHPALQKKMPRT